jgi:hypothetical protein
MLIDHWFESTPIKARSVTVIAIVGNFVSAPESGLRWQAASGNRHAFGEVNGKQGDEAMRRRHWIKECHGWSAAFQVVPRSAPIPAWRIAVGGRKGNAVGVVLEDLSTELYSKRVISNFNPKLPFQENVAPVQDVPAERFSDNAVPVASRDSPHECEASRTAAFTRLAAVGRGPHHSSEVPSMQYMDAHFLYRTHLRNKAGHPKIRLSRCTGST